MTIGITGCGKYENYRRWIAEADPGGTIVRLGAGGAGAEAVEKLDGLVLSGGEDIHPARYGEPGYVEAFGLNEIDTARDEAEYHILQAALAAGKPVLGICRGLQLANAFLGGTLVPDLPSVKRVQGHGKIAGVDQRHPISLMPGSMLAEVTGLTQGVVNSAHHQSVDKAAASLAVTATDDDGIVEAMEWREPEEHPWLLLVQWHPERMEDPENPLSERVRQIFLENCAKA